MSIIGRSSLLMSLIILVFAIPSINAQTQKLNQDTKVRGKVVRIVKSKSYPAAYVRVTVAPHEAKDRRNSVYTGSDGFFYFLVKKGNYILEVWNSQNKLIASYNVVANNPNVDLEIKIP